MEEDTTSQEQHQDYNQDSFHAHNITIEATGVY